MTDNTADASAPDTIVLVHGFWVTPLSWEKLFIVGSEDNIMPPAVNQSNVKHYRHAKTVTDYKEFEGRSRFSVIGGEGWEEVADYALAWATEHATTRPAT